MIDKVTDIHLGTSAIGHKMVTANEPHFEGHFPRRPVMPGVLIIEAMAQTASIMVGLTNELVDNDVLVYFMSLEKAKKANNEVQNLLASGMIQPSFAPWASGKVMVKKKGR